MTFAETIDLWLGNTHIVAFLLILFALVAEYLLYQPEMSRRKLRMILFVDLVYAGAASLILATGLILVIFGSKELSYFTQNPAFYAKFTLFFILAGLSMYASYNYASKFFDNKKSAKKRRTRGEKKTVTETTAATETYHMPVAVKWCIVAEVVVLMLMLFLSMIG